MSWKSIFSPKNRMRLEETKETNFTLREKRREKPTKEKGEKWSFFTPKSFFLSPFGKLFEKVFDFSLMRFVSRDFFPLLLHSREH